MRPWLLDVNVLLGILWPSHGFHSRAIQWFLSHREEGWATCPLTETGFLRVVTNPAFTTNTPCIADAIELPVASKQSSNTHRFWSADITGDQAVEQFGARIFGHKRIPDAYLLALAIHHRGKLATFDRRILHLAPEGSAERASLEILQ